MRGRPQSPLPVLHSALTHLHIKAATSDFSDILEKKEELHQRNANIDLNIEQAFFLRVLYLLTSDFYRRAIRSLLPGSRALQSPLPSLMFSLIPGSCSPLSTVQIKFPLLIDVLWSHLHFNSLLRYFPKLKQLFPTLGRSTMQSAEMIFLHLNTHMQ